jgi:hypothetical protein
MLWSAADIISCPIQRRVESLRPYQMYLLVWVGSPAATTRWEVATGGATDRMRHLFWAENVRVARVPSAWTGWQRLSGWVGTAGLRGRWFG